MFHIEPWIGFKQKTLSAHPDDIAPAFGTLRSRWVPTTSKFAPPYWFKIDPFASSIMVRPFPFDKSWGSLERSFFRVTLDQNPAFKHGPAFVFQMHNEVFPSHAWHKAPLHLIPLMSLETTKMESTQQRFAMSSLPWFC